MEWAAIALVAVVAIGDRAEAADEKRFGEEILEILKEDGTIDDERYEELKAKEAAEALPAVSSEPDEWTIKYSRGLQLNRNDGMAKIKIGGRIQADFASLHTNSELETAVPGGDGEGVEFRRARFYMSGEAYKRIIWKSQIDFSTGAVVLADMYIGMKDLGFLGTAKVGHQKEPYSLEELTSSKYITFMERPLPSVFDSVRNFGLSFSNTALDERITWSAGIFALTGSTGSTFSSSADLNVGGRITGLPLYEDEGRRLVHVGVSGAYQSRDDTAFRFRQRPEIHLAQRYLDTGNAPDLLSDGSGLLGLEIATVCGPFHLSSEWKQVWVDETIRGTSQAYGAYVTAGYFLTGEHRPYKTSNGTWIGVDPLEPFDPANDQWGAFEIATRYSFVDVDEKNLDGGRGQNFGFALNWYLFNNVRVSANYIYAQVKDTGDFLGNANGYVHGFQTRAQIEF
jgi:phosphate-selective porin OprO/OprP